jgi:hypothetical protein
MKYFNNNKYYEQLFQQYINLCNRVIADNRYSFPYSHILKYDTKKNITIKIIDDSPKIEFAVSLEDESLKVSQNNLPEENKVLLLKINQLEDIIRNQNEYLSNPEKINWNLLNEFI